MYSSRTPSCFDKPQLLLLAKLTGYKYSSIGYLNAPPYIITYGILIASISDWDWIILIIGNRSNLARSGASYFSLPKKLNEFILSVSPSIVSTGTSCSSTSTVKLSDSDAAL